MACCRSCLHAGALACLCVALPSWADERLHHAPAFGPSVLADRAQEADRRSRAFGPAPWSSASPDPWGRALAERQGLGRDFAWRLGGVQADAAGGRWLLKRARGQTMLAYSWTF